jgi:hypothetical protein
MVRRRADPNASMPFRPSPGSFKCSSMQWLLLQQMHYRGAEGRLSLARYRAFLKHAKKFSSHDQQSSRHGVWPTCGPNCAAYIAGNFPGTLGPSTNPASFSGGLIVTAGARGEAHRELIVNLAARQRLHTIYPSRNWVSDGGGSPAGPFRPRRRGDRLKRHELISLPPRRQNQRVRNRAFSARNAADSSSTHLLNHLC